jgi:hypothetical protein
MADTDLPNGFGAIDRPSGPARPPRPIASPFGMLADPWATPAPTPGFNVEQPDSSQANPMAALLASLMPSRQDLKQGVADTLGAPVDGMAWMLHRMGLPVPGGIGQADAITRTINGNPEVWRPSASVPLGSTDIRGMLDNAPSAAAKYLAATSSPSRALTALDLPLGMWKVR